MSLAVPVGTALFDLRELIRFFDLIFDSSASSKCISASSTPGTSSTIFRACTISIENEACVSNVVEIEMIYMGDRCEALYILFLRRNALLALATQDLQVFPHQQLPDRPLG